MADTYRSYLQGLANNGNKEALGLLQVVGDDGRVNDTFQAKGTSVNVSGGQFNKGQINSLNSNYYGQFNNRGNDGGSYVGGGGSGGGSGATAAQERALYDDQINYLNSILGNLGTQRDQGVRRIDQSADATARRLAEQKAKAMAGYDQQTLKNAQDKQKGVENVDDFANNSYKNLMRVLLGANAGSSSVSRELVPTLISKSAGTRRQGVFNTAGENEQAIVSARGDAEDQYRYSEEDLGNQRRQSKEDFLRGILGQEQELLGKRSSLEAQRAAASGASYEGTRAATAGTRAELDSRNAQLNALFGQFAPSFTAKAVNTKTPELGQFQVDPAQIRADQNMPGESRYYLSQIKKKQQQEGVV